MKIEYFEIGPYGWGHIFRCSIDTTNKKYLSHTDDSVTFTDSYTDEYWETRYRDVTMTRNFNKIRDELIASHKQKIAELQKEVDILETSDTIEKYNSIIYKDK